MCIELGFHSPEKLLLPTAQFLKRLNELTLSQENAVELAALMSAINRLSRLRH
jgi:hypothetical protein